MTPGVSTRRRLLAIALPVAVAGCFEDPDAGAAPAEDDDPADADDEDATDGDSDDDTQEDGPDEESTATPTPREVDPDDAGIEVVSAEIDGVEGGFRHTLTADVTVRNVGDHTYGTLELRVDAFHHPPGRNEENPIGFAYATREFSGFASGTREYEDVSITYDGSDADNSTDPNEFSLSVAVRRAETG